MIARWTQERALLGGLILDGTQVQEIAAELTAADFERPQHGNLFDLLVEMSWYAVPDLVTVCVEIERRDPLQYEGIAYVCALPNDCPSVENLAVYASRIRGDGRRRAIATATASLKEAINNGADIDAAVASFVGIVEASTIEAVDPTQPGHRHADVVASEGFAEIQARAANPDRSAGMPTGITGLDACLGGLYPGKLVVLAARPAMGKSMLAEQIALEVAAAGYGVHIVSLEMGRQELYDRAMANRAKVDATGIKYGQLEERGWRKVQTATEELAGYALTIDDAASQSLAHIRRRVRRWKSTVNPKAKLGLVVIDYLQLMHVQTERGGNREQAVASVSRGLKMLANEAQVAILLLSQLNRSVETRTSDRRPKLSDLRESGAIEQDADAVLFLYRDEVYEPDSPDKGIVEIIVSKHRGGESGVTVKAKWLPQEQRIVNAFDPAPPIPPPARYPPTWMDRTEGGDRW